MQRLTRTVAGAALLLLLAGCDTAYSPGRPRVSPNAAGVRPATTPQAVLSNVTLAYDLRNLSLYLTQLDAQRFALGNILTGYCNYDCISRQLQDDLLNEDLRDVRFSTSPDTLPIETFAPLDPPGAVAFALRWTILDRNFRDGRGVRLVRGATITVAPTGAQPAPWRIVRWAWTAPDTTSWPTYRPPGWGFIAFPWGEAILATPAGAVRSLEQAFSHAQVSNAVSVFYATVDSARFEHSWEKLSTDSTQIGGRGAAAEAKFLAGISATDSFTDLKLTLIASADSSGPAPRPSTDPRDPPGALVFDLPNTGQHYGYGPHVFDVNFRHSVLTVAPRTSRTGATEWRVVRWFDRGPLDPATIARR